MPLFFLPSPDPFVGGSGLVVYFSLSVSGFTTIPPPFQLRGVINNQTHFQPTYPTLHSGHSLAQSTSVRFRPKPQTTLPSPPSQLHPTSSPLRIPSFGNSFYTPNFNHLSIFLLSGSHLKSEFRSTNLGLSSRFRRTDSSSPSLSLLEPSS